MECQICNFRGAVHAACFKNGMVFMVCEECLIILIIKDILRAHSRIIKFDRSKDNETASTEFREEIAHTDAGEEWYIFRKRRADQLLEKVLKEEG